MSQPEQPRIALVCDWLTTVGGAEQVLLALHQLYPTAPIYTSQYRPQGIDWFKDADVRTGWLDHFPAKLRRVLGPLRQHYFSHLDLSDYDIVISVTGAEAKAVRTVSDRGKAVHFCYCHVPTQYYWGMYDEYLKHPGFGPLDPLARRVLKTLIKPLRRADYRAARQPDYYITISQYSASLIRRYYNRKSKLISPPVNLQTFQQPVENNKTKKGKSQVEKTEQPERPLRLINFSRQVNWKHLDIAVKACLSTGTHLTLIGDGPEHAHLVKLAAGSPLIQFLPALPQDQLRQHLTTADAFVFPSLEPFGIAPVEALAAGCPVIAYGAGGALDYIQPGQNGAFFPRQNARSLAQAIREFHPEEFSPTIVARSIRRFSSDRFKQNIQDFINENYQ